jgi:hypothetical protein
VERAVRGKTLELAEVLKRGRDRAHSHGTSCSVRLPVRARQPKQGPVFGDQPSRAEPFYTFGCPHVRHADTVVPSNRCLIGFYT